jgi:voltage-gated sodium channel
MAVHHPQQTTPSSAPTPPTWRSRLAQRVESPVFQRTLIALILVNALILGLETSPAAMARWGPLLLGVDQVILALFVVEIALRLVAHGPRFFRDPWSVFDFTVVAISLLPAAGPFAVLRALRVLRVLRLLTLAPNMRRVVGGLLRALPGLTSVFGVMMIIFYVSAVIATKLFGERFPEWFGSLGASGYTLFQVMTLESWSMGIARPVIEAFPHAWIFFLVFILISTFTMLNLFIAVIVNAMHSEELAEAHVVQRHEDPATASVKAELVAVREELAGLRRLLESPYGLRGPGAASGTARPH